MGSHHPLVGVLLLPRKGERMNEREVNLLTLQQTCRKVAAYDTCYWAQREDWKPDTLIGHCKCVAAVVQLRHGGELVHDKIAGVPHIWNRLPDGTEVDLCGEQFGHEGISAIKRGKRSRPTQMSNRVHLFINRLEEYEDAWLLSPYTLHKPAEAAGQPSKRS